MLVQRWGIKNLVGKKKLRWILWSTEESRKNPQKDAPHTQFPENKASQASLCYLWFYLNPNLFIETSTNTHTHTLRRHSYWSGFYFLCLALISLTAFGQMPKSSSAYSRWSTYLRGADLHSWLDFVISVIVLISQSQLASGKNRQKEEEKRGGEGGEGGRPEVRPCRIIFLWRFISILMNYRKMCQTHFICGQFVMRRWRVSLSRQQCVIAQAVTQTSGV